MTQNANITDDQIRSSTTESGEDQDQGGQHGQDAGDEPTEADDDRDQGGEGPRDTGDEA